MNLNRANIYQLPAAFTLIEVIIAVAISAIVLASIGTLFFGALRLRDRVSDAAAQNLPMDRAIAIMKQDMMNMVPAGTLAGPMGTDATMTSGMTTQPALELFTANGTLVDDQPWGDVEKVDYMLQSPTNHVNYSGHDLVRGVTRNLLAINTVLPEPQTLLQDVQNLQFSYYDGTNWNDSWSTTLSNIPIAIKVMIDFNNPKGSAMARPSIQFVVPVASWSSTNSATNMVSN
jgi:type II secretion system protein J